MNENEKFKGESVARWGWNVSHEEVASATVTPEGKKRIVIERGVFGPIEVGGLVTLTIHTEADEFVREVGRLIEDVPLEEEADKADSAKKHKLVIDLEPDLKDLLE
jgi:hypothetical protein